MRRRFSFQRQTTDLDSALVAQVKHPRARSQTSRAGFENHSFPNKESGHQRRGLLNFNELLSAPSLMATQGDHQENEQRALIGSESHLQLYWSLGCGPRVNACLNGAVAKYYTLDELPVNDSKALQVWIPREWKVLIQLPIELVGHFLLNYKEMDQFWIVELQPQTHFPLCISRGQKVLEAVLFNKEGDKAKIRCAQQSIEQFCSEGSKPISLTQACNSAAEERQNERRKIEYQGKYWPKHASLPQSLGKFQCAEISQKAQRLGSNFTYSLPNEKRDKGDNLGSDEGFATCRCKKIMYISKKCGCRKRGTQCISRCRCLGCLNR